MSNSRRQRRQLAKSFGLLGKEQSISQKRERFRRSNEMGQQFHLRHLEETVNSQIEIERKREEEKIIEASKKLQEEDLNELSLSNSGSFSFLQEINNSEVTGSNE